MSGLIQKIREEREKTSEIWFAECPQCGISLTNENDGHPCPNGCKETDRSGRKTPLIVDKNKLNIKYKGLKPEEIEKIKERYHGR